MHELTTLSVCISGGECLTTQLRYADGLRWSLALPDSVEVFVLQDIVTPLGLIMPSARYCNILDLSAIVPMPLVTLIAGTGSVAVKFIMNRGSERVPKKECLRRDDFSISMTNWVAGGQNLVMQVRDTTVCCREGIGSISSYNGQDGGNQS